MEEQHIKTKKTLKELIIQLLKFGVTGVINTGLDFIILNILIYLSNITEGTKLSLLNIISFTLATVNSYFINKYWTFKDKSKARQAVQFSQFITISIIGAVINSVLVGIITSTFAAPWDISPTLWANGAKILATGASLIWNFLGYKFIVFKKKEEESNETSSTTEE